jgi:hypothetical protein
VRTGALAVLVAGSAMLAFVACGDGNGESLSIRTVAGRRAAIE